VLIIVYHVVWIVGNYDVRIIGYCVAEGMSDSTFSANIVLNQTVTKSIHLQPRLTI